VIPSAVRDHTLLLVPRQSFLPGNVGSLQNLKKELGMSHILEVRGLQVAFAGERGNTIGTDRIDFFVDQGETVCLVGESGISGCYGAFGPGRPCVTGRNPF